MMPQNGISMAITILSANLNQYGSAGQFETDRSSWGFGDDSSVVLRSTLHKKSGIYSAQVTKYTGSGDSLLIPFRFNCAVGKKYVVSAYVYSPSVNPIGADESIITLTNSLDNFLFNFNVISSVDKTVEEAKVTWEKVSIYLDCTSLILPYGAGNLRIVTALNGGILFVDELEIYEYTGTPEEEPDPEDPEEPEPVPETFDLVYFSKNPIVLEKSAPDGWDELINYRLYNDVRIETVTGSGEYISKLKIELPPDTEGKVNFVVRQAFRGSLTAIPPTKNFSDLVRLTDRIKLFKHYTGELQDDDVTPEEADLVEGSRMLVLLGGINKQKFPGLNFFTTFLPTTKKFMSWAPIEKVVDRLQEDYLNFWVYDEEINTLKLNIKVYYEDGSNETEIVNTITPVAYGQLYQIPTGPLNSGVADIDVTKTILKYELSILDQDDVVISEVRTYHVAKVRHPLTRFFMFLNSLGSYEVLRFTGQADFKTEFDKEVIQKFLSHDYASADGESEVNNAFMQEKTNYSTGFFTGIYAKAWQQYMKDLILSPRVFDVTNGSRIPVIVSSNTLDGGSDQSYLRFARVDVQKSYIDESYTPDDI